MKFISLAIPDIILFEPEIFDDERGFFLERFNQRKIVEAIGFSPVFVQDNHSRSKKHVLRGLHYQLDPRAQAKLVHVVQGEVFDVVVDIRKGSSTFGKWVGAKLSADNNRQLWIPEGFAHGFVVLSDTADFLYKTTDYYDSEFERCISWNDPQININWTIDAEPLLSKKDQQAQSFSEAEYFV